jgi:NADH-quinone oxidoreductase subunit I
MGRVNFRDIRREERLLGGKRIPVAVLPRLSRNAGVWSAARSLLRSMRLTLHYLVRPSTVATRQYPENRATLKFPERYRAVLRLVEEEGCHRCAAACRLCEKSCPNGSIKVISRMGAISGKVELDRYIWRQDSCTLCNACIQACPFGALEMRPDFENAVYDRRLLIYTLNRYAGPPASVLHKEENPEARRKMMEPRDRYGGPVPANGYFLPNVPPLGGAPGPDAAAMDPVAGKGEPA